SWQLTDPRTKELVTAVYGRWGYTPAPPGQYLLTVRHGDSEFVYATVEIGQDKVLKVAVNSGIEVTGRFEKEPPLQYWHVDDAKTKKRLTSVHARWGFLPLPPGKYTVTIQPRDGTELPWTTLTVTRGKTAPVTINSGIELSGKSDKDPPLENWYVQDARKKRDQEAVARVQRRWGFTPLPPGR